MSRALVMLALALAAACASHAKPPRVEVLLDERAAAAGGMGALVASFDVSPSRLAVVGDKDHLWALGWGGAVPIEGAEADAFAYTRDGLLLAVRGAQLWSFTAGAFAPLYDLPNAGMALSRGDGDTMYLFDRATSTGLYGIYRLSPGRQAMKVLDSPQPIDAVADVGGRVVFATGGVVFSAQPGKPMTVVARLAGTAKIVAVAGEAGKLYFSDGASVYVLANRHVARIAQVPGGTLRVRDHSLFVFDAKTRLLVRVAGLP